MSDPRAPVSLALLLAQAGKFMNAQLDEALRANGLTVEQYRVLLQLADGQGHVMAEVAEQAVLPPATLTRVVDRLSQLNLVHRRVDALDRRRVLLYLSHRGTPVLAQVVNHEASVTHQLESRLGVVDFRHLLDTLQAVIAPAVTAPAGDEAS